MVAFSSFNSGFFVFQLVGYIKVVIASKTVFRGVLHFFSPFVYFKNTYAMIGLSIFNLN